MSYQYNTPAFECLPKNLSRVSIEELLELEDREIFTMIPLLLEAERIPEARELSDYIIKRGFEKPRIKEKIKDTVYRLCGRNKELARNISQEFSNGYDMDEWFEECTVATFKSYRD